MLTPTALRRILFAALACVVFAPEARAGRIVLAHDEWTLSNRGFNGDFGRNDAGTYVLNVADWFLGGGTGSFLAYSNNFGLTEGELRRTMRDAGHQWSAGTSGVRFDLPTLSMFDAIFLAGTQPPGRMSVYTQTLIDYVEGGGNVYLAGGTGLGGANVESERWNGFLRHFGLEMRPPYNNVRGSLPVDSTHPIFSDVDFLYQNNGNGLFDLDPNDPSNQVLIKDGSRGLYAIYDPMPDGPGGPGEPVPVPGTVVLVSLGLAALIARRSRRTFSRADERARPSGSPR